MNLLLKFIPLVFLTACGGIENPKISVLWQDHVARNFLKAEHYEDALQNYYTLIEDDPRYYGTHSNVGVLLNMIQRPDDALKSLDHALEVAKQNNDFAGEFSVRFNLGVYYTSAKSIEKALENYQAALEIVPNSIETKTNIELLIQQQQKQGQGQGGQGDPKENKDNKDQNKDQNSDQNKSNEGDKPKDDQKRESSAKYKPRPFKGEQLSEGDVKKILGELRNQEQKIRANFDKREKGKSQRNEKDW